MNSINKEKRMINLIASTKRMSERPETIKSISYCAAAGAEGFAAFGGFAVFGRFARSKN